MKYHMLYVSVTLMAIANVTGVEHENQTEIREREGVIASTYYDLRIDGPLVRSGMPPQWPHALLSVSATASQWKWAETSIVASPPGSPIARQADIPTEKRDDIEITLRQSLWTPWPYDAAVEFRAMGSSRTFDGGTTDAKSSTQLGDPIIMLDLPLYQERYAGVMLGIGTQLGAGDNADWHTAHGKAGIITSLRWSTLVPFASLTTLTVSIENQRISQATQDLFTATTPTDITCDYHQLDVGTRLTWRPTRVVALGGTLGYQSRSWSNITVPGFAISPNESVSRYPIIADATFTVASHQYVRIWVGEAGGVMVGASYNLAAW